MAIHSPLDDPKQIFLDNVPLIEKAAHHACGGVHLQTEEVKDFISCVHVKFMDNDYEILRKFQGKSTIRTYLITCVGNYFKDYLNHLWGKWRPSEEAKRLGRVAIDLERLLVRDGHTLHEACEILLTNFHVEMSRQELEKLAGRLPYRTQRQPSEGVEALDSVPAPGKDPEEGLLEKEREEERRRMIDALARARQTLSPEDRRILRMRNDEGLQVSTIARILKTEQKPLYRRLEKIYKTLGEFLRREGFDPKDGP
jgi:RNA polymerase sigma factor (sigma-70 family)